MNFCLHWLFKEALNVDSPSAEDSSSNDESLDQDADAEVQQNVEEVKLEVPEEPHSPLEEKQGEEEEEEEEEEEDEEDEEEENEIEIQKKDENETPEQPLFGDRSEEEHDRQPKLRIVEKSGVGVRVDTQKEDTLMRHDAKTAAVQQHRHKVFQVCVFGINCVIFNLNKHHVLFSKFMMKNGLAFLHSTTNLPCH
jgi:hypothetical protein